MEFFDSPSFTYFWAIVMVIMVNICPYLVSAENSASWRVGMALIASITFVLGYLGILWALTNKFFIVFVMIFAFSYAHFCFTLKNRVNFILYTIIFIAISLFFALWTTAMFGKYYVKNSLVDFSSFMPQYHAIIEANEWFPILDFKFSVLFFEVSFEKYFILPNDISLKNPFFIQFIFGIIISGTIISWAIDVLKYFIAPSKSN